MIHGEMRRSIPYGMLAVAVAALLMLLALPAMAEGKPELMITEACGDNDFVWPVGFSDYLELYNPRQESVQLGSYTLRVGKKTARLPEVTLQPGAYHVLVCGSDYPSLSKGGFTAELVDDGGSVVDSVTVPECKNRVWLRDQGLSCLASPGYANTPEGCGQWHASVQGELLISEALSNNFQAYVDHGRGHDAVELQNVSDQAVRLSAYYLSDDLHRLKKYRLPDVTLRPGGYYVVLCEEEDETWNGFTGFKLSSGGDMVYLSDESGRVVDVMNIPPLGVDVSFGWLDGAPGYMPSATLGKANGGRLLHGVAEAPVLSEGSSGGHTQPFQVTMTGTGPIRYTLDGSEPTAASALYTGPVEIAGSTTLRAAVIPEDMVPSDTVTAVYRFDTAEYALPCVFITTDPAYMTNDRYGLLTNPEDKTLEVPAHVTYLQEDGQPLFALSCGLSIAGQTARVRSNRGWKVSFRSRYGEDHLEAKVFDDMEAACFDSLLFRLGTMGIPYHDILGTAVGAEEMPDVLYQRYRPVNLFVAGRYYGIYYLREHVNENYVVNHLGGSEDQVDIFHHVSDVKAGSGEDWLALVDYCRSHDLSVQEHYEYVAARVNVDSFIDYFIWRPYTGDTDHPNIRYVRVRDAEDPRWHVVIYDMDWAFQRRDIGMNRYTYQLFDDAAHNNVVIYALLQNQGFREAFLSRLSYHMSHTFAPERVEGILDGMMEAVAEDMPKNMARWNIAASKQEKMLQGIRSFIRTRTYDRRTVLLKETQQFFRLTDGEMTALFGGLWPPVP